MNPHDPVQYVDLGPRPRDDEEGGPYRLFAILFVLFVTAIIIVTTAAVFFPLMTPRGRMAPMQSTGQPGASDARR